MQEYRLDRPSKCGVEDIPEDIILTVMTYLSLPDIIRSSSTCKQWRVIICKDEFLWQYLCFRTWKRWPHLHINENRTQSASSNTRTSSSTTLNVLPEPFSREYPFQFAVTDGFDTVNSENFFAKLFQERYAGQHFSYSPKRYLKDLNAILNLNRTVWNSATENCISTRVQHLGEDVFEHLKTQLSPDRDIDLTFRYFGTRVLKRIHSSMWIQEWSKLLQDVQSGKPVTMMDGALLFCQRDIYFDAQKEVLDPLQALADKVKKQVQNNDPIHILQACIRVMEQEGFTGDRANYYNVDNWYDYSSTLTTCSYVNATMKSGKGIPITLCAIFDALARLCGVTLEAIAAPCHFLLRHSSGVFVDPFNGKLLNRQQAVQLVIDAIGPQLATAENGDREVLYKELEYLTIAAPMKAIFQRMLNNILFNSKRQANQISEDHMVSLLSLSLLFDETNYKNRLSKLEMLVQTGDVNQVAAEIQYIEENFTEIAEFYNTNALAKFIGQIKRVSEEIFKQYNEVDPATKPLQKACTPEIQYRIGQIIRHKRYHYRGVIFGYDPHCALSNEWQRQMRIEELPNGSKQPFYNVLVDERDRHHQTTYVAQENIQLVGKEDEIRHEEVGRYFGRFNRDEGCYVPNEYSQHLYPGL